MVFRTYDKYSFVSNEGGTNGFNYYPINRYSYQAGE